MTDRSQFSAGVPRLIDQYKQRRQAWLDQADELARLREEVRLAAEREALDIVTAARRDVRRIVVDARRELLVLTAQLHAAIESVDHAALQPGTPPPLDAPNLTRHLDTLGDLQSLGATRDAVLDARREVRHVLDEARAEIEALTAEVGAPLSEDADLAGVLEPPIPTLDSILGTSPPATGTAPSAGDGTARLAGSQGQPTPSSAPLAFTLVDDQDKPLAGPATPPAAAPVAATPSPSPSSLPTSPTSAEPSELTGERDRDAEAPQSSFFHEYGAPAAPSRGGWGRAAAAIVAVVALGAGAWWVLGRPGDAEEEAAGPAIESAAPARAVEPEPPAGLSISVLRTAWMRAVIDGKEDSRVYQPGETRLITGAKAVSLRVGDGDAVHVSVNGAPAEPMGPGGQPVTRDFTLGSPSAPVEPAVATSPASGPGGAESPSLPAPRAPGLAGAVPPAGAPAVQSSRPAEPAAATTAVSSPAPPAADPPAPPTAGPETGGVPATGGRVDLVAAGQQWLDAYQRRDRDGMAAAGTANMTISDERAPAERFAASQSGVRRELDQVELELTGDTALLTARMTERAGDGAAPSAHVSRVSQIWVRRNGRWRVADVRIIGEARLNQIVR